MADKIKPARSYMANYVPLPTSLVTNEIAINYADAKLYVKTPAGTIQSIALGGGGSSGGGIFEAATAADFPSVGVSGLLYVSTDANRIYRWAGVYVETGPQ